MEASATPWRSSPLAGDPSVLDNVTRLVLAPIRTPARTLASVSSSPAPKFSPDETLARPAIFLAAVQSIPKPSRDHHQHHRGRLALSARGIDPNQTVAPPSSSSSPMTAAMKSGEPDHGKPRRHARRDPVPQRCQSTLIIMLSLQEDAFALLAPLSFAEIADLANGDPHNPALPQMVVHLRANVSSAVLQEGLFHDTGMDFLETLVS
ncbi:hypothetical protein QYE76_062853 [Lolium multiflorum]|uniref:Uncharacterized protein n=1 Tax=Lolium multiflorum TaxID=4521 RepID=A0AAD8W6I2_LOLMU|nr:hypothetical protein QYE76_062853 [Lolium multiflorum]